MMTGARLFEIRSENPDHMDGFGWARWIFRLYFLVVWW